jgi:hypothetical protein
MPHSAGCSGHITEWDGGGDNSQGQAGASFMSSFHGVSANGATADVQNHVRLTLSAANGRGLTANVTGGPQPAHKPSAPTRLDEDSRFRTQTGAIWHGYRSGRACRWYRLSRAARLGGLDVAPRRLAAARGRYRCGCRDPGSVHSSDPVIMLFACVVVRAITLE